MIITIMIAMKVNVDSPVIALMISILIMNIVNIIAIIIIISAIAIMIMTKVNVDSREAELSWLGSWLVYLLVATVEIIISAANTTFNQVQIQIQIQIQKCIFFRFSSPASTKLT